MATRNRVSRRRNDAAYRESRKEKSRECAKKRRTCQKSVMEDLTALLPFPTDVTSSLDNSSLLRLILCYFKLKSLTGSAGEEEGETPIGEGEDDKRSPSSSPVGMELQQMNGNHGNRDLRMMMRHTGVFQDLFVEALDGLIMVILLDGTIMYISETMLKHLGLFQSEHIGTSVYNLLHANDQSSFKENIAKAERKAERSPNGVTKVSFFCRIRCSRFKINNTNSLSPGFKMVYISGTLKVQGSEPYLVCLVQPVNPPSILEVRSEGNMFVTHHSMEMKCTFYDGRLWHLLGYKKNELIGTIPFSTHHHDDIQSTLDCCKSAMEKGEALSSYYRMLTKFGHYIWIQTRATIMKCGRSGSPSYVICMHYVISKEDGDRYLSQRMLTSSSSGASSSTNKQALLISHDPFPVASHSHSDEDKLTCPLMDKQEVGSQQGSPSPYNPTAASPSSSTMFSPNNSASFSLNNSAAFSPNNSATFSPNSATFSPSSSTMFSPNSSAAISPASTHVSDTASSMDSSNFSLDTNPHSLVTAASPLYTAASPLDTTASPLNTAASPLDTTASPLDTTTSSLDTITPSFTSSFDASTDFDSNFLESLLQQNDPPSVTSNEAISSFTLSDTLSPASSFYSSPCPSVSNYSPKSGYLSSDIPSVSNESQHSPLSVHSVIHPQSHDASPCSHDTSPQSHDTLYQLHDTPPQSHDNLLQSRNTTSYGAATNSITNVIRPNSSSSDEGCPRDSSSSTSPINTLSTSTTLPSSAGALDSLLCDMDLGYQSDQVSPLHHSQAVSATTVSLTSQREYPPRFVPLTNSGQFYAAATFSQGRSVPAPVYSGVTTGVASWSGSNGLGNGHVTYNEMKFVVSGNDQRYVAQVPNSFQHLTH